MWSEADLDPHNVETQLQLDAPAGGFDVTSTEPIPMPVPVASVANPEDTVILPVAGLIAGIEVVGTPMLTQSQATSTIKEATSREATGPRDPSRPGTPSIAGQPQEQQKKPARNSKHSQTEKYLCPHDDCSRSKPGSGFNRKDHLGQHLRGPHNQTLVPRFRREPAGNLSIPEPTVKSKKRKRISEAELSPYDSDDISNELAEERRLRQLAEQENERLRQRIENYEERMQKYEDRLDRMMSLFQEQKGKEKM